MCKYILFGLLRVLKTKQLELVANIENVQVVHQTPISLEKLFLASLGSHLCATAPGWCGGSWAETCAQLLQTWAVGPASLHILLQAFEFLTLA